MEKFPKKKENKNINIELTSEELEKLYEVKISPGSSWSDIEAGYKEHESIAFVVTKEFQIYMSASGHASIYTATDSWDYTCRGFVSENGGIDFYERAVENKAVIISKLKKFLNSRGLKTPW